MGELRRGDIVSYRVTPAGMAPQEMVHRIVGLPGERLESGPDGGVLINGATLAENYLPAGMTTYLREPMDVPADHFFVMGDNRGRSSDSRVAGPIARADILARFVEAVPVKSDEDDACDVVPGEPAASGETAGRPLTVNESDPPAVQLVILPIVLQQLANLNVTAANLDAVRAEVERQTDRLEALLGQVGSTGQQTHRILAEEVLPALRAMIATQNAEEWPVRKEGLAAAMNHHLQAMRSDVLGG